MTEGERREGKRDGGREEEQREQREFDVSVCMRLCQQMYPILNK